ncbi:MAG TPA: winged helix-turn-helix domain-containing protein [Candidatus Micrarchaeaceae archaeon]|nr:winged helix-turn-helix domain-containing protein [Candidatus Micrarchaeaceae archaeon]
MAKTSRRLTAACSLEFHGGTSPAESGRQRHGDTECFVFRHGRCGREIQPVSYNQMVVAYCANAESAEQRTDRVFNALADRTRRDILRRAMDGEHSVSDLARSYPMSFAAVQKHVAVLERAGLVVKHPRGREQLVLTDVDAGRTALRLLDQLEVLWRSRIDRFAEVLAEPTKGADQ